MNSSSSKTKTTFNSAGYMRFGFAMGMACMVALFIAGLVKGNVGMVVMASTTAAMLGGVWASTSAAAKKKAVKDSAAA